MRNHFRTLFEQWGCPQQMRFDNGVPWGTNSPMPSLLALWLVGLGILPRFGRPRRSTDNAVVERSHGILNGWVEPHKATSPQTLQTALDQMVRFQREVYPACQGRSRLTVFPELLACPRPFQTAQEANQWQPQRLFEYLATFRFQRKVELNGRFTLFSREYSLGRAYKRLTVALQMDAATRQWVVYDEYGNRLRSFDPRDLTYEAIVNFALTSRPRP